jgi:peptidoglycan DL-endopeptidase CwlO
MQKEIGGSRWVRLLPLFVLVLLVVMAMGLAAALAATADPVGDPGTETTLPGDSSTIEPPPDTTLPPLEPPSTSPSLPDEVTTVTGPPAPSPEEERLRAEEARRRQEEAQRRIARLQALVREVTAKQLEVFRASVELDLIDEELGSKIEAYNRAVLELDEAKQKAQRLQLQLEVTQRQLSGALELLEQRLVAAYKTDLSAIGVLLDTTDMADLVNRVSLLVSIARSDRLRVDEVGALRARASRVLDQLSRQIYEVTSASRRLEAEKQVVEEKLGERRDYVERLSAELRLLVDEQREVGVNAVPAGFDVGAYLSADGQGVVQTALRYLGVPYVWGGASPAGFDCSGLVQYVFTQHGIYLPHYSGHQAMMGFEVPLAEVRPGDLVFFGTPVYHVGIAMGDGLFVHAPRTGDVVKISSLAARQDLSHVRRLVAADDSSSRAW